MDFRITDHNESQQGAICGQEKHKRLLGFSVAYCMQLLGECSLNEDCVEMCLTCQQKKTIVMEYASVGELFEKICNAGRFNEDEAKFFFQQLISVISPEEECHSLAGVTHLLFQSVCFRFTKIRGAMSPEMLEIHQQKLTFVFELKKQSSDTVQLFNNPDQFIAFKVKTTSPKKYCVRPNIGIIKPKSTCDFTVTMQGQREASPYMQWKDNFFVQSIIFPYGTTKEDITSELIPLQEDFSASPLIF